MARILFSTDYNNHLTDEGNPSSFFIFILKKLAAFICENPCPTNGRRARPISIHAFKNSFSPAIKSSYVSLLLIVEKLSQSTRISHVRGRVL